MEPDTRARAGVGLNRRIVIGILVVAGTILSGIGGVPAASATNDDTGSTPITWAVGPSGASGPDGRSWVELELDPGATARDHFAVRNLGDRDVTFSLTAADGYLTPTGRFNMLPSDKESMDAGTWISMEKTVNVAAGGTTVVPFTVKVPGNATPGDHAAGIAASTFSEGAQDGARLGVESRIGFRVMTRVTGEVQPRLEAQAEGNYETSWNPFEPGSVELSVVLENTGNVRLSVDGSTTLNGSRAPAAGTEEARPMELMPGDRRTLHLQSRQVWPLGIMTVPLTVSQGVVAPDGSINGLEPLLQDVAVWAIPVPQLVIIFALFLVTSGSFWGRRRRDKQLASLVAEARETGRREAEHRQVVR
ncbi:WxL protein peptidoglycan domain-containing protein [Pseudarthrobacter sp. Y6]|uniref:COG1470 family protein n=1 Tax=Pseudarthrobacter sp. Y6 TaxID=3418422 RepID=UPI003CF6C13C